MDLHKIAGLIGAPAYSEDEGEPMYVEIWLGRNGDFATMISEMWAKAHPRSESEKVTRVLVTKELLAALSLTFGSAPEPGIDALIRRPKAVGEFVLEWMRRSAQ